MPKFPYAFYIALDGNGIDGFEGAAGVCAFWFDPSTNAYDYRVRFFEGLGGGHSVTISPGGKLGHLGTVGQHLSFFDPESLEETDRFSTLQLRSNVHSLHGTTHVAWVDDETLVFPVGDAFFRGEIGALASAESIGEHGVTIPHGLRINRAHTQLYYGALDHPEGEAAQCVGIFDLERGKARRIPLPTTCWHVELHPDLERFYAVSYRVCPQLPDRGFRQWAFELARQYVYELDPHRGAVVRHWTGSREIPAHLNSDVTVSRKEVLFCAAGSHALVAIDLEDLGRFRVVEQHPGLRGQLGALGQAATTLYDGFARGSLFTSAHHFLSVLRISRFALFDGTYATRLSADESLLFTANRGLNRIVVYDYPSLEERLSVEMPDISRYLPRHARRSWDPRLGFHHGHLVGPRSP